MPKTDRAWARVVRQAKATIDDDTKPDFYNFTPDPDDESEMLDAQFSQLHIDRVFDPLACA